MEALPLLAGVAQRKMRAGTADLPNKENIPGDQLVFDEHADMVGNVSRCVKESECERPYLNRLIVGHVHRTGMRRALVQHFRRPGSLDHMGIPSNMIRMRMRAYYVGDFEPERFGSIQDTFGGVGRVDDNPLPAGLIADQIAEVTVNVDRDLFEDHPI